MKFAWVLLLGLLTCAFAANWMPEDYEIFNLKDLIEGDLGSGTTFYSWLGLSKGSKSSLEEINKAYRKRSRQIHPDKFHSAKKSVKKKAEERFQRLSLVGNILRDQSLKKRYDYFLDKGFPKWKGTGYYYSRFRPGMGTTVIFLYVLVGLFHFVSVKINRKQDYKRVVQLKEQIKSQAWNGSILPPEDGSDRKITNSMNGKEFIVHNSGEVSLFETAEDGSPIYHPIDENQIRVDIGFKDTIFFKLPVFFYNQTLGRFLGQIDTSEKLPEPKTLENDSSKKTKKKNNNKGDRIELPNGKVIYGRSNAKKRK